MLVNTVQSAAEKEVGSELDLGDWSEYVDYSWASNERGWLVGRQADRSRAFVFWDKYLFVMWQQSDIWKAGDERSCWAEPVPGVCHPYSFFFSHLSPSSPFSPPSFAFFLSRSFTGDNAVLIMNYLLII